MIEQPARVTAVSADAVWVEPAPVDGCARCAAGTGCGAGLLYRLFARRAARLAVVAPQPVAVGDTLILALSEGSLLRGAALLYGLPAVGLLGGALAGDAVPLPGDGAAALGALAGLAAGALLGARASRRRGEPAYVAAPGGPASPPRAAFPGSPG